MSIDKYTIYDAVCDGCGEGISPGENFYSESDLLKKMIELGWLTDSGGMDYCGNCHDKKACPECCNEMTKNRENGEEFYRCVCCGYEYLF